MNSNNKEDSLILEILRNIEEDGELTQRGLAQKLGVALGLTNSYLKRCIRKGLVKIRQAPSNRYFYYLTPRGFTEKSRLTAKFLSSSFEMYRRASTDYREVMKACRSRYSGGVIFIGISELAEIALLRAQESGVRVIGVFDPDTMVTDFVSLPVLGKGMIPSQAEAAILTVMHDKSGLIARLGEENNTLPVLVPEFLSYISQPLNAGEYA